MIKHNVKANAQSRRRERRMAKQEAWKSENPLLVGSHPGAAPLAASDEALEAKELYEPVPIKFIAQDAVWQREEYKRNLERAAIVYSSEFSHPIVDLSGQCLSEIALFNAGHRKTNNVTAR